MASTKTCLYCGEPIAGRTDKRYCTSACKSRDFREQGGARTTVVINTMGSPIPAVSGAPDDAPVRRAPRTNVEPRQARALPPDQPMMKPEPPAPLPPVRPIVEVIREAAQAESAKRILAELQEDYQDAVENFLEEENATLGETTLRSMKDQVSDVISRYREHPLLKQSNDLHRKRLEDLYTIRDEMANALADAQRQPIWKSKESSYQLKDKVRRKMRERLIG